MRSQLEILPLGGLKEIGKNCMLIKHENDAIMIDCGMGFPGNDNFMGEDFFIPDFNIIEELGINLLGCVVTHGHEDHIGGTPYLLQRFDVPVFMTNFPAKALEERIMRFAKYKNIKTLNYKKTPTINLGKFTIDMLDVPHSIPEAKALIIKVGDFTLLHTGDFKYDSPQQSPFSGKTPEQVDILLSDSTNIEREGRSENESSILGNISRIIENARGRVIATAFSSNSVRINNIITISMLKGRQVGLLGRSVKSYVKIASELGHISLPDSILTDPLRINSAPDNKITLIVTGSQAEPRSVMRRMSLDAMKSVSIKRGDTIIFSSKNIPGNEVSIGRMIDNLIEKGASVYYENTDKIHVSGHAFQDDIVQTFKDVNPKYVVPIHGYRRFLELSAKLAEKNGYKALLISDGEMLSFTKDKSPIVTRKFDLEQKIVSNELPDLVGSENISERKRVADGGFLTLMIVADLFTNELLAEPRIVSAGIANAANMKKIEIEIKNIVDEYFKKELPDEPYWKDVEEEIRIKVRKHLISITNKRPTVNVIIVNPD